jgi:Domain of unknown function (DUF397)
MRGAAVAITGKPDIGSLGIDVGAQAWQSSGAGPRVVEIAMVDVAGQRWVLTRVSGDPDGPVLLYDRHEWECFLDGAKRGEFDDAAI